MTNIYFYPITILILYIILQSSTTRSTNTSKLIGFTTYLIHRDSFESPMFDSSLSQTNLVERAIRRSRSRLSHLKSILNLPDDAKEINDIESTIVRTNEEHLMEIFVGTPPVKQLAIIDTASDIVWTQCLPSCHKCYKQIPPIYNSRHSSTYNVLPCNATQCKYLGSRIRCVEDTQKCEYEVPYEDKATTCGYLALETFKIGNTLLPNMVYGCSKLTEGIFSMNTAGIIGLGPGPLSLVSQLDNLIDGKFSYCLVNWMRPNTRSKISFGANSIVSGRGTVSTPLVEKKRLRFYHITLEAVSVENTRILFKRVTKSIEDKKFVKEGNMIIDSGTMLTYLPRYMYQELEDVLKSVVQAEPVQNPPGDSKLCYENITNLQMPTIIFHLAGGANLYLTWESTSFQYEGFTCLAILPDDNDLALFGHMSQMDYFIGYDLKNLRIHFTPTNCSIA